MHLSPAFRAAHPEAVEWTRQAVRACSRETFAAECDENSRLRDLRPELSRIHVSVLIRSGEEDKVIPPAVSRELAGLIAGAKLELVPGVGHQLFAEDPEAAWESVRAFLAA